jgi:flagellar motor switch protein FliN
MLGALSFAGGVAGNLNIQVTTDLAQRMSAEMLGLEPEEIEGEETKDTLGEICNIVGGGLKSALNDSGFACVISTPSLTYGTDFTIKSSAMDRFERFVFVIEQDTIIVEVGLKMQATSGNEAETASAGAMGPLTESDIEKIKGWDFKTKMTETVVEAYDTMLSIELEPAESVTRFDLEGVRNVGSVSFAGDVTGMVSIQVGETFARVMMATMLDCDVEEIEGTEEIEDLLCEISNIIGGNLKSVFTDAGLACALSTPSFTTGRDFKVEPLGMEQYQRFAFKYGEYLVFTEMGVKVSDFIQVAGQAEKNVSYTADDGSPAESGLEADSVALEPEPEVSQPWAAMHEEIAEPGHQPQEVPPQSANLAREAAQEVRQPVKSAPAQAPVENAMDTNRQEDLRRVKDFDMDLILDIPIELTVEIGRTRIPIHELLKLKSGSAVTLSKLENEPVDILANDTLIARGQVVVQDEKYGIRVTEIASRMDRIKSLS